MKIVKLIGIVLLIGFFGTCDLGTNGDDGNTDNTEGITIDSLSIQTTGIKSLYVGNISTNSNARAATDFNIQTLSYINNSGKNVPLVLLSANSGLTYVLDVSQAGKKMEARQLSDKHILVYNADTFLAVSIEGSTYEYGTHMSYGFGNINKLLINMETGKIYDFTEYDNIQLATNEMSFWLKDKTLYKVDMNNISVAVPLNNQTYSPINFIYPPIVINSKVLNVNDKYCFDITNAYPPMSLQDRSIKSVECSFTNQTVDFYSTSSTADNFVVLDLQNNPWYYLKSGNQYFTTKISLDNDAKVSITDWAEGFISFTPSGEGNIFLMNSASNGKIGDKIYSAPISTGTIGNPDFFNNNGLTIIYDNGFINFKKKSNGIDIQSTALTLPAINKNNSFIKDNYLYFLEGTTIKRIYLSSGNSSEVVYNNPRLFTGGNNNDIIIPSGNNLIFYQYANDNITVNTYSLPMYRLYTEPILLSTSSVDMRDIIELDF